MTVNTTELAGITGATSGLTESERYGLLSDERRRLVLDVLADRTTPVTLDRLAEAVVAHEDGLDPDDDGTVERMRIDLHHRHLPKMAALDVIDYDPQSNRVTG
jgi:hypothetical protein